jgi:hypothetical protein
MNDNQNYFVKAGRTTSRVLAQPGGRCSISIGGWTQEELSRNKKVIEGKWMNRTCAFRAASVSLTCRPTSRLITAAVIQEKSEPEKQEEEESPVEKENVVETKKMDEPKAPAAASVKPSDPAPQPKKTVSSNAFASSSTSNSFNVVTDRTTSRVKMPPGGHSSIRLW